MELDKLKNLLGITGDEKDDALQFVIDDVTEMIVDYCNINELPEGLKNTAYRMAMDLYRGVGPGEEDSPLGPVTSIKEGDITTSFASTADNLRSGPLSGYKTQLNRFRRIKF